MNVLPITGYLGRLSARPGEFLNSMISMREGGRYRCGLVRVLCADPNPEGPGVHFEDLSALYDVEHDGRSQPIRLGSWAEAPGPVLDGTAATWTALVMPGMAQAQQRVVLHHASEAGSITLTVGPTGVEAVLASEGATHIAQAAGLVRHDRWHRVWASLDTASGKLLAGFHSPPHLYLPAKEQEGKASVPRAIALPSGGKVLIAAAQPRGAGYAFHRED